MKLIFVFLLIIIITISGCTKSPSEKSSVPYYSIIHTSETTKNITLHSTLDFEEIQMRWASMIRNENKYADFFTQAEGNKRWELVYIKIDGENREMLGFLTSSGSYWKYPNNTYLDKELFNEFLQKK